MEANVDVDGLRAERLAEQNNQHVEQLEENKDQESASESSSDSEGDIDDEECMEGPVLYTSKPKGMRRLKSEIDRDERVSLDLDATRGLLSLQIKPKYRVFIP